MKDLNNTEGPPKQLQDQFTANPNTQLNAHAQLDSQNSTYTTPTTNAGNAAAAVMQDNTNSDMDIDPRLRATSGNASNCARSRPSIIPELGDAVERLELFPTDNNLQLTTKQSIWILPELIEVVQPDCEVAQIDEAVGIKNFKLLTWSSPFELPPVFDTKVFKKNPYYYVSMSWAARAIPHTLSLRWPHWQSSNVDNGTSASG